MRLQSRHCVGSESTLHFHHMTEQHPPPSAIDCVDVVRSGFKLDATVSSKLTLNTLRWCLFRISSTALGGACAWVVGPGTLTQMGEGLVDVARYGRPIPFHSSIPCSLQSVEVRKRRLAR